MRTVICSDSKRAAESTEADKARLQEMFAARRAPGSVSDKEYLAGQTNGSETPFLRKMAKKLYGFTPGPNDVYSPQLARQHRPFEPGAWVPAGNARGHVKKWCQAIGAGCEGLVKVEKPTDLAPTPEVPLAEPVVRDIAAQMIRKNPDVAKMKKGELREIIIKKHSRKK